MSTYVLLHGGWSGGWVWQQVADDLRAHGHRVFTPTLSGYGERSHLLSPSITLTTLVDDVINVLAWEELEGVALIAHSLNGAVAQAVAARVPQRLSHLVLLDAFLVRDGESTADTFDSAYTAGIQQWVDAAGEGWFVPRLEPAEDSVDAREARGRHTAFPWRPYLEPVKLGGLSSPTVARTYILCTDREDSPVDTAILASAQRARADGWNVLEFPSGHVPMWTAPQHLSQLFQALAAGAQS
ncbi:alpha/beta fold hydrolase [Deinococcus koreensis]|uniref:Alpha/beta hydrolase n=1 Tax=Deinococcus koreensis TaxID=2054903 RepID=A0A2K3V0Q2_9DEIO|nr:alpha/beta hydrolase [Deinococcus koreensis]PNY82361.1 alpha/beta hydrolase [Deinococcus koreensis]